MLPPCTGRRDLRGYLYISPRRADYTIPEAPGCRPTAPVPPRTFTTSAVEKSQTAAACGSLAQPLLRRQESTDSRSHVCGSHAPRTVISSAVEKSTTAVVRSRSYRRGRCDPVGGRWQNGDRSWISGTAIVLQGLEGSRHHTEYNN